MFVQTTDVWAGVAYDVVADDVFVVNTQGDIYIERDSSLVFETSSGVSALDIAHGVGSLWVLHSDIDGNLVATSIEQNPTSYNLNIPAASSASMAWDRFGYYIYVQTESALFRYNPVSGASEQYCRTGRSSHGMFITIGNIVTVGEDQVNVNEIPYAIVAHDCGSGSATFASGIQFTSYKFDAAEVCAPVSPVPIPETEEVPEPETEPEVVAVPDPDPPAAGTTTGTTGGQSQGSSSGGARFPGSNDNYVVESPYSTVILGGIGASAVGFFAFFAVVLGFNNTKKDPETPLSVVLEDTEAGTSAYVNPTFQGANDAQINIVAS